MESLKEVGAVALIMAIILVTALEFIFPWLVN